MVFQNSHGSAGRKIVGYVNIYAKSAQPFFSARCWLFCMVLLSLCMPVYVLAESDTDDLIAMLENENSEVRQQSVDALVALGSQAVDPLIAAKPEQARTVAMVNPPRNCPTHV